MLEQKIDKLLIASVTPSFLEKGVDWFLQNFKNIEESRQNDSFWRRNTAIIETGQKISLSEFLRQVAELGYSKVWETSRKGEFSQRGGVVHIYPINGEKIFYIEFEGNYISHISQNFAEENSGRGRAGANYNKFLNRERRGLKNFQTQSFGIAPGDHVVHIDHGIGIFKEETETDFVLEYASGDTLYVPKENAEKRLSPYLGFKKPHIHRLGTPVWNIIKKKAKEDIVAFAKELLEILAKRKMVERPAYQAHPEQEDEFEASFEHTDTPDQRKAILEIFSDMEKSVPMERILTGDVGFGKTEVALRAAFRVILNNKQVALIAPTTILADQHLGVAKKRLEQFGVSAAKVSRLEDDSEIKKTFEKAKNGSLDILIGTHKLLGNNLEFKNLGLLIIDEEQKFGVAHKEHFKKINPALDILTLSATPIPRTLNTALSGIANISTIETAPLGKMTIQTYVLPKNKKIIKEAIEHELERNGQIYFLANRIHSMPRILEEIKNLKIKPSAGWRIGVLHGRMGEKTIINTMRDFRNKKFNLLLSTTIIENGLDISEANTLIVEDATKLGLSQAHQLRGRIGRGDKEAHAYFLYPTQKLKERAEERLEAFERYSWLGAGLEIAKRDLEIRGAGNILGKAQSGVAYKVGLNLYFQLLEETISELKRK